jgi:hypothetical protein
MSKEVECSLAKWLREFNEPKEVMATLGIVSLET